METIDFDYHLPQEAIAQEPAAPRDSSRLLVFKRSNNQVEHTRFCEISNYLSPGDLLILNETKVIPARLFAHKVDTGGKVELLLLRQISELTWEILVGGSKILVGVALKVVEGPMARITEVKDSSRRIIEFSEPINDVLDNIGKTPLPPYIKSELKDRDRYQTVYSKYPGSAAAPTAGLHFTEKLLTEIRQKGINVARVILHIGLDTFAPVLENSPENHSIHSEWCSLSRQTAMVINDTKKRGGRVIAVGTTSVRTLETSSKKAYEKGVVTEYEGFTNLFILPGYQFQVVDGLITNFHLPKSTLIMMVSAFAGRKKILSLYQEAIKLGYRFYSFGDAMMIL